MSLIKGVAYYPEFWGESQWKDDLRDMRALGINLVRIAEFAWVQMEPAEGRFALDWVARFLDLAAAHDIAVLLCTPTACPPKWLTTRYPDTRLVLPGGRIHGDYLRKHYCPNSPTFRRFALRIITQMAGVAAQHGRVVAWQIDNELGAHECGRCFCPTCLAQFRGWLKARYGSVARLNAAWQTDYWSQRVSDWSEIELPVHRTEPSVNLDFLRFYHDSVKDFYRAQAQQLRSSGVRVPITTNFMGPMYESLDYWDFGRSVDSVCYDSYMQDMNPASVSLGMDIMRNLRQAPFWLSETGTQGETAGTPRRSELRLWMFKTIARGARGHVYFRWRTCLAGGEQSHRALLTHSRRRTRGVAEAQAAFAATSALAEHLEHLPLPRCAAALLLDWQALLSHGIPTEFRPGGMIEGQNEFLAAYAHLLRRGVTVDVIPPDRDLTPYRLVVMPGRFNRLRNAAQADRLTAFVRRGGVLVATATTFSKDEYNNHFVEDQPSGLTGLLGLCVGEWRSSTLGWAGTWGAPERRQHVAAGGGLFPAGLVAEELILDGASVWFRFADGWLKGQPAVTAHRFGRGLAIYVGTIPDTGLYAQVLDRASRAAKLALRFLPDGVEYVDCSPYHIFLNSAAASRRVLRAPAGTVLLGRRTKGVVQLEPYGVCLIRE